MLSEERTPARFWRFIVSLGLMFAFSVALVVYFITANIYDRVGSLVVRFRNRCS